LSGEYPSLLKKRALACMRLAKRLLDEGEYDLAVFNAEYALQLYIKSILYRITGEEWRGHGIRSLLGLLASLLRREGFSEYSDMIIDYVSRYRRILAEIEEAHTRAIYGALPYSKDQAVQIIRQAEETLKLLQRIEEGVFKHG
jgi:HEPN domain-containing protein